VVCLEFDAKNHSSRQLVQIASPNNQYLHRFTLL